MPVPTDITAGTISISGSTVTGVGTSFVASDIRQGDLFIWIEGGEGQWSPIVQTVTSNTVLTLAEPWTGPTISGARYRLRYQWDSSRVSAQSRQLIEMLDNGNVLALAGLTGPGVPVFDGPHSMTIRPEADFINGVAYDVQVDTLADRAAYDGQAAGFAVLVSDVGDGRSAVYSKASNTSGDWTDPAYVTGATGGSGPYTEITFGPVTTLPAGQDASASTVQIDPDTIRVDLSIPRGVNGTGTGDVVGPPSSGNNRIAVFDGVTGKLIKDSGSTLSDLGGKIPHLSGLTTAPSVSFANGILVSPGSASALQDNTTMKLTSAMDKNINFVWSPGNSQGGLDTGSFSNGTYHIHLIAKAGGLDVDVLLSTSPTSPVMPATYVLSRRIGCFIAVAGNIVKYRQVGGWFHYLDAFEKSGGAVAFASAGSQAITMDIPLGVKLNIDFAVGSVAPAGSTGVFTGICDPDLGAAGIFDTVIYNNGGSSSVTLWGQVQAISNTAAQLNFYVNSPSSVRAFIRGYYDLRDTYF